MSSSNTAVAETTTHAQEMQKESAYSFFWGIADSVAGHTKFRKAGSITATAGGITTGLSFLFSGKVGLIMFVVGLLAVATGLIMRFFPSKQEVEEAKEVVTPKKLEEKPEQRPEDTIVGKETTEQDVLTSIAKELGLTEGFWNQCYQTGKSHVKNNTTPNTKKGKDQVRWYNAVVHLANERS